MECRTVEVEARTVLEARGAAVRSLRQQMFDPIRVRSSRCLGFVDFDEAGGRFRYSVQVEGVTLTEGEAREVYGR